MQVRFLLFCVSLCAQGAELRLWPEYVRTGPDGDVVAADRAAPANAASKPVRAARAGYASLQVAVRLRSPGEYTFRVQSPLQADVFREWYHRLEKDQAWHPDALVPVKVPHTARLPDPDNRIGNQQVQAYWIDIWVPAGTQPGEYPLTFRLESAEGNAEAAVKVRVLPAVIPDEDAVVIDHNSYGSSWIGDLYPGERGRSGADFYRSDAFFRLVHAYHRIFYEHRGVFHQLGYGHAGKVGPEFAPALAGTGRNKHIAGWDLYDRHYGPLFDGSAFRGSRRGERPIPFAYLPINPEWPASYLWWGEPGYEAEFGNVVSEMERHFREKGWTHTRLELFFNHKKRYMGFPWDGDEVRFPEDDWYFREYGRMFRNAVPKDSPVRFVFRADTSWSMEQQSKELEGIVNMWICGDGILSWYPQVAREMKRRGDIVWFYSGPPPVTQAAAKITEFPLQAWLWGIDGYVHWLTVSAGADPWFRFDGGGTALVYSGERFGIEGPIPSIRLKVQRNAVQDLALLESFQTRRPVTELRAEAARRFNGSKPEDWWNPRPAIADRPPMEWTNGEIDAATAGTRNMLRKTRPDAWENVHAFVMQLAEELQ
ncbi:MAG: DUF4091 domain-containing protein [Bryobacterales bacterium]|nr:DUF4091 domain-containing protein [Bryobacterales bacterium]